LLAAAFRRLTARSNVVLPPFQIVPLEGRAIDIGDGTPAFRLIERERDALRVLYSLDGLAVAEAYMAGQLDIDGDLIAATRYQEVMGDRHLWIRLWRRLHPLLVGRERVNPDWIALHYDAANAQLFAADRDFNTYTPGVYRSDSDSLEAGAERKLAQAFEHLGLRRGDHLLEVGSGWGGMVRYAARRGVRVTGVTLSRDQKAHVDALIAREKLDAQVLAVLSGVAQSAAKFATDLRLLQHEGELLEPFESEQVGSSAMPYKRNPMRAERMTSLARFVIELEGNAWHTAAAQWLERTLDDSANRRLVIPEAFLATDAILVLATNVAAGLEVREDTIAQHVANAMPFLATERLLMRGDARVTPFSATAPPLARTCSSREKNGESAGTNSVIG